MADDQDDDAPGTQEHPRTGAQHQLGAPLALRPEAEHRRDVVVDPHPLGLAGVAPDQDREARGQEHGPADDPDEADMEE